MAFTASHLTNPMPPGAVLQTVFLNLMNNAWFNSCGNVKPSSPQLQWVLPRLDIAELVDHLQKFSSSQMIGIGNDLTPFYNEITKAYR